MTSPARRSTARRCSSSGTAFAASPMSAVTTSSTTCPPASYTVRAQYIGYAPAEVRQRPRLRRPDDDDQHPAGAARDRGRRRSRSRSSRRRSCRATRWRRSRSLAGELIQSPAGGQREPDAPPAAGRRRRPPAAMTIRGGRPGEAATYIDGVLVRSLTGTTTSVSVGTNAIEEASVTTGAIGAEYGDAQSGVVSYVTRAGRPAAHAATSAYATDNSAGQVYGIGLNRVEASLGGPLRAEPHLLRGHDAAGPAERPPRQGRADRPRSTCSTASTPPSRSPVKPGAAASDSQVRRAAERSPRYSNGCRRPRSRGSSNYSSTASCSTPSARARASPSRSTTRVAWGSTRARGNTYNPMAQSAIWNGPSAFIVNWTQNLVQGLGSGRCSWTRRSATRRTRRSTAPSIRRGSPTTRRRSCGSRWRSRRSSLTWNFPIDDRLIQNLRLNNCTDGRDAARPTIGGCIPYRTAPTWTARPCTASARTGSTARRPASPPTVRPPAERGVARHRPGQLRLAGEPLQPRPFRR